jgi:predicted metal-dependent phosphoesterase TrpH
LTRIDLHSHTTHSDGVLTPEALLARAANAGVTHLAVTDHDTVTGLLDAARAAAAHCVELVPGIEVSVTFNGRECHILGHNIAPLFEPLVRWSEERAIERRARIERIVVWLQGKGLRITIEDVLQEAQQKTLARPHVARALLKLGYVSNFQDAFDKYLARREINDLKWSRPTSREAIDLIHSAGGTASVAHPGANRISRAELKSLADEGLDAVEAFHLDHPGTQSGAFVRWAKDFGLHWTGGSDFHGGPGFMVELGGIVTPPDQWSALNERARARSTDPAIAQARCEFLAASRIEVLTKEHVPDDARS